MSSAVWKEVPMEALAREHPVCSNVAGLQQVSGFIGFRIFICFGRGSGFQGVGFWVWFGVLG